MTTAHSLSDRKSEHDRDHGYALLTVLIVGMLIGGISLAISIKVVRVANESAELVQDVEVRSSLEAAINRMIASYIKPGDPLRARLVPDGRRVPWPLDGNELFLTVQAESGKFDVNAADTAYIDRLLAVICSQQPDCMQIGTRIEDARLQGRKIRSLLEILTPFQRMTSSRERISSYFTTLTDQKGVDIRTAPLTTLDTIQDLPDDFRRAVKLSRNKGTLPALELPSTGPFVEEKPIYTMRAITGRGFFQRRSLSAVVYFSERGGAYVLSWHSGGDLTDPAGESERRE